MHTSDVQLFRCVTMKENTLVTSHEVTVVQIRVTNHTPILSHIQLYNSKYGESTHIHTAYSAGTYVHSRAFAYGRRPTTKL